jgi:hypothetical protein
MHGIRRDLTIPHFHEPFNMIVYTNLVSAFTHLDMGGWRPGDNSLGYWRNLGSGGVLRRAFCKSS